MRQTRIGITGSSGSGKSTVAREIAKHYESQGVVCQTISLDDFYRDAMDVNTTNWDDPSAFDHKCFGEFLIKLQNEPGKAIAYPKYNFSTSSRSKELNHTNPNATLFIFEGIFAHHTDITLYTKTIFVETDPALCFERRKKRDIAERGKTEQQVYDAWDKQVFPAFLNHILPHKNTAHIVIANDDLNTGLQFDLTEVVHAINTDETVQTSHFRCRLLPLPPVPAIVATIAAPSESCEM